MQYTTLFGALLLAASSQAALDSSQLEFLTRFVNDARSHTKEYLSYVQTADANIPKDFESLAKQIYATTGDGYTSEFDSAKVKTLESFATGMPWYDSRIAGSGSGSDSSESGSGSSGSSSSSSSSSSTESSSASATGGAVGLMVPAGAGIAALAIALL
ncbi:DEHA2E02662p [Debaryomyces hansenii CBS767]|uniref:DEHA2E02662p n=1 Tax=Debaryomyces hansenii (strain ATCC 36239 / CBS 767 / BCRC 21394 / JCM 1990 / NBRC 0083 / IGC 2968) TaxID=284592 RepID=Q6BQS5_DEBHA|nr:DEHA2E02662p [Debaryomyces hansenii CBS767]CAG87661.1 DEHA2E02662p [Debaryomyces hansenii CBS767]|eukprot:XP_459445.1 DEHA2E02662p [Debaryomyces hansenii CBS767]